ncbi:hypothetical protein DMX04_14345 [Pseudomonas koreensis]|nr:hypothetical protein DMX04_14345 [Pseudomonas koreensis]
MMFSGNGRFLKGLEHAVFSMTFPESQRVQLLTRSELNDTGGAHGSHVMDSLKVARLRITE